MTDSSMKSIRARPTDFSRGDDGAFAHAVRIALAFRSELHLLHVGTLGEATDWADFPGVRDRLIRWGMLQPGGASS